jgi:hypothetical protein
MTKKTKLILLVILIVISGFLREFVMVNINWIIKHLTLGNPNYAQSIFDPMLNWDVSNLVLLKWLLTMFFTVYFFSLTYIIIKQKFQNKIYNGYVVLFYLALIIGATIIYGLGMATNSIQNVYTSTRTLMGIIQSFVPLMILYLFIKFGENQNVTKQ